MKTDRAEEGHTPQVDFARMVLRRLKQGGFQVLKERVRLPDQHVARGLRFDFLLRRRGRKFAVELKVARGFADWFLHWLARSILTLQATQRVRGLEPLLAVGVESLEPARVNRFRSEMALYAPSLWWLLVDEHENVAAHLPDGDEEDLRRVPPAGGRSWGVMAGPSSVRWSPLGYAGSRLAFGDLSLWLFKVLLFGPRGGSGWGGPRGPIRNLRQLATLAKVSPPLVYRWASAMERSGYLSKAGRVPVLRDLDALLAEWRGRYRIGDNDATPCEPVFPGPVDDRFHEEFLQRLQRLGEKRVVYALSGHQACRLYGLRHSEARTIHVYVAKEYPGLVETLQIVASHDPDAPIHLLRPKHARSAFGGLTQLQGVQVCDLLQVYLDLSHLPDRGREQAEFVRERALAPVLRAAVEP